MRELPVLGPNSLLTKLVFEDKANAETMPVALNLEALCSQLNQNQSGKRSTQSPVSEGYFQPHPATSSPLESGSSSKI